MRKSKFKAGEAIIFEPEWALEKFKGGITYKTASGEHHPLKYGDIVNFLADHSPAYGHCIVVTYEGQVITMLHPEDFRKAKDTDV
jgi:hypothetical protein